KMVRFSFGAIAETHYPPEKALTGALRLRIDRAVDRVADVLRIQDTAVMELYLRSQLEGVGQSIIGDGEALGEPWAKGVGTRQIAHQPVEHRLDQAEIRSIVADRRIESAHVIEEGNGHSAAVLDIRRVWRGRPCQPARKHCARSEQTPRDFHQST